MKRITDKVLTGVVLGHAVLDLPTVFIRNITPTGTAVSQQFEMHLMRYTAQSGGGYVRPGELLTIGKKG